MAKVVVTHAVADVQAWLGHKQERADAIGSLGGSNVVDHVAHDGSNVVAVSADIADPDAFMATLASPPAALGEIMQKHGVQPPLTAYIEG